MSWRLFSQVIISAGIQMLKQPEFIEPLPCLNPYHRLVHLLIETIPLYKGKLQNNYGLTEQLTMQTTTKQHTSAC
jgi:hypothetical protein